MVIKEYSLSDLAQRVLSGDFWRGEVIPITKQRALAQIRNPRARPEDVVLLIAYDGDRICGYSGVLPDVVFLEGRAHRIGWLTAWWRKPGPKYRGVGALLMLQALKRYDGALGLSPPSDAARKVVEASNQFVTVNETTELRAFIRANTREMLPRKFPTLNKFKLFLGAFDGLVNILCETRLRLWKWRYDIAGELRLEYIAEIDPETADFVRKLQDHDLSRRGPSELNWIAQYPWVLSAPLKQGRVENFYFSATAKESACFMLKIFDSKDLMIGFIMLRLTNGHLMVPYCYTHSDYVQEIFRVIGEHAVTLPVHALTIGRAALRESLQRLRFPCLAKMKSAKSWIVGNVYGSKVSGQLEIQDGDGDCAFF
jgi:hypothetical protein